MEELTAFFSERHFADLPLEHEYNDLQMGRKIQALTPDRGDWTTANIVIVGCGEQRASTSSQAWSSAPDAIRQQFYQLYNWHPQIELADLGNLREGAHISDSRAALRLALEEIYEAGKIALVLGGSQDLTLQQYEVFKKKELLTNVAVIDSLIDLEDTENIDDRNYLMSMLTGQPNFVEHFSQLCFQSYYINPKMLQTLDDLRFDCFRVGKVREDIEEMEPVLRDCGVVSVDMNVLRRSDAPFLKDASPNGLFGDELCQLLRYAGAGSRLSSLGIYGYHPENDPERQGAKLIAQMLWYFIDGCSIRAKEADLGNRSDFFEFHVSLTEFDILFLKSKKTDRWWMQDHNEKMIPCTYKDYLKAVNDEIPERWMRAHERIV